MSRAKPMAARQLACISHPAAAAAAASPRPPAVQSQTRLQSNPRRWQRRLRQGRWTPRRSAASTPTTTCASSWSRGCAPTAARWRRRAPLPLASAPSAPQTPGARGGRCCRAGCWSPVTAPRQPRSLHAHCDSSAANGSPTALPFPRHSALVKVGATSALAGIKCEVVPALPDAPDAGRLTVQVRAKARAQRPGTCMPGGVHAGVCRRAVAEC